MNETKEHILKTSLLLFLQKNYKEVTMREIVKKTALSKGAFYHYFSSKEQLFKEIVLMFFSMGAMDYTSFPKLSLKSFINEYLKRIDQSFIQINQMMGNEANGGVSFNFFFIMFEAMKRFPEMLKLEEQIYKDDLKVWETIIDKAKTNGEIVSASSSKDLANLFLYCTDGVFIRVVNTEIQVKYTDQLKTAFFSIYDNLKV